MFPWWMTIVRSLWLSNRTRGIGKFVFSVCTINISGILINFRLWIYWVCVLQISQIRSFVSTSSSKLDWNDYASCFNINLSISCDTMLLQHPQMLLRWISSWPVNIFKSLPTTFTNFSISKFKNSKLSCCSNHFLSCLAAQFKIRFYSRTYLLLLSKYSTIVIA